MRGAGGEVTSRAAGACYRPRENRSRTNGTRRQCDTRWRDRSGPHRRSKPRPLASTPMKGERVPAQIARTWHRRAPGCFSAVRRSTSRTRVRRRIGNSPPLAAFSHRFGLAPAHLCTDTVEKRHSRATGREVLFEFEVPLEAIPFQKPNGEAGLLFRRKRLNRVLNLGQVHIRILPRRGERWASLPSGTPAWPHPIATTRILRNDARINSQRRRGADFQSAAFRLFGTRFGACPAGVPMSRDAAGTSACATVQQ